MTRLLILKTGSTYPEIRDHFGDFESWFLRELADSREAMTVDVSAGEDPGQPADWRGIIVTGSPAMVTDRESWSEKTAAWLRAAVNESVPVLGVCYGHQLLAHGMGGEVGYRPKGRESGTFEVQLTPAGDSDPLFGQLPARFPAHLTHAQSVLTLPEDAVLLACSPGERYQAFRIGQHAWGVQFHPEFNAEIMRAYLGIQAPRLQDEGQDAEALLAAVGETPVAAGLIQRFVEYVDRVGEGLR
ncbi:GMP synthase (glutamine-hydrolysing) [Marinobacter daqiaonensis]|uniref:GMP synthase (Glutamine-hydrolysing) n=1 Tax=Marinobacter daqiaonensis TaxID=650891 RepID=A0A1I6JVU9_9GAMM|nr:glutamine amidotransferase [Marinobacter daqiaonensis]SFR83102.1 GMP synthase (glutamine-hydrolysing) [Marinobacter daqiaonensis]